MQNQEHNNTEAATRSQIETEIETETNNSNSNENILHTSSPTHQAETTTTTASSTSMPPLNLPPNLKFGPFTIPPTQVFHLSKSRLTFSLVNLKPLLPGHILICPVRPVPRLNQLTTQETSDLFLTVRRVSRTLERVYRASSFNVAVQDGKSAGQSVPHVHVHVIPRVDGDLDDQGGSDRIYELLDGDVGDLGGELIGKMLDERRKVRDRVGRQFGGPDADAGRVARSDDVMGREADWLRIEMAKDADADGVDEEEDA